MTLRAKTDTDLTHVYYWKIINVETVSVSKWKVNNKCFPLYFIYKYEHPVSRASFCFFFTEDTEIEQAKERLCWQGEI